MKQWFVARTQPGKEVKASVNVAAIGFGVFLPVRLVMVAHAGKRETVSRPLFPRYLFAQFDRDTAQFGRINGCRGVANRGLIVNADSRPIPVKDEIIEAIRHRENIMKAKAGEIRTGYQPGDKFQIPIGPFADFEASYLGEDKGTVSAIVHMFCRGHVVELPFESVPICHNRIDNFAA